VIGTDIARQGLFLGLMITLRDRVFPEKYLADLDIGTKTT